MKDTVLLVDDDIMTYELVKAALRDSEIILCKDLKEAEKELLAHQYGSIILDLNLPDGDGLRFLSKIRNIPELRNVPVTILSSEVGISHKVMAFEYGCDDYVVKPFDPLEFRSRVNSRMRRAREKQDNSSMVSIGELSIDLQTYSAVIKSPTGSKDLGLTPLEIKILFLMSQNIGQVFSRTQIMEYLWKDTFVSDRTVDSHIAHLRQKIATAPVTVDTVKGVGYKISKK